MFQMAGETEEGNQDKHKGRKRDRTKNMSTDRGRKGDVLGAESAPYPRPGTETEFWFGKVDKQQNYG